MRFRVGIATSPASGHITLGFGDVDELHPHGHAGIDIGASEGAPILAPAAGLADTYSLAFPGHAELKAEFGNFVILDHGDCFTLYAHLSRILVADGASVALGELLGLVGSTGKVTGPHLHWGMAKPGNRYFNWPPNVGPVGTLLNPLDFAGG